MQNKFRLVLDNELVVDYWFRVRSYGRGKFFSWLYGTRSDGKKLKFLDPYPASIWKKTELLKELHREFNWEGSDDEL